MSFNLKKQLTLSGAIGIDINDRSIEVVELIKEGSHIKLKNRGRMTLDFNIVERGRIKDPERLAKILLDTMSQAKPNTILPSKKSFLLKIFPPKINFSLAESQIYTHIFQLEAKFNKEEIKKQVAKEVSKQIPLDQNDLIYSYKITVEQDKSLQVFIIAASRKMIEEWQNFFSKLGFKIEFFDSEILATFRGLLLKQDKMPAAIIDLGSAATSITIFDKNNPVYSYSIDIAGDSITTEIAGALQIKKDAAEYLKLKHGIASPDQKIFPITIKMLEKIAAEIKISLDYFQKKSGKTIQNIILVGGTSRLKGLIGYLQANLGIENIFIGESILANQEAPLEYIKSIGLALVGIEPRFKQKSPFIYLKYDPKKYKKLKIAPDEPKDPIQENIIKKKKAWQFWKQEKKPEKININQINHSSPKKIILLIIILILGLASLAGAFWYRNSQRVKRAAEIKSKALKTIQMQTIEVVVPIAVAPEEYTADRAAGKIIKNTIEIARSYDETIASSRQQAESMLGPKEILWEEPINAPDSKNIIFPVNFTWIAFNKEQAEELLIQEIDKLNKEKIDYIVNNIKETAINPTTNPNIFSLTGRIIVSAHAALPSPAPIIPVSPPPSPAKAITPPPLTQKIPIINTPVEIPASQPPEQITNTQSNLRLIIKKTELGWLNVRSGPDTTYDLVTKIYPGETYPLLESAEKWYKIKIEDNVEGWIYSAYAEIIR